MYRTKHDIETSVIELKRAESDIPSESDETFYEFTITESLKVMSSEN